MTSLIEGSLPLVSSHLGVVETGAALARAHRDRRLSAATLGVARDLLAEDAITFTLVDLDEDVAARALEMTRVYRLSGADAVHLASATLYAEQTDDEVSIVTSDQLLAQAAAHAGLASLDPVVEERRRKRSR